MQDLFPAGDGPTNCRPARARALRLGCLSSETNIANIINNAWRPLNQFKTARAGMRQAYGVCCRAVCRLALRMSCILREPGRAMWADRILPEGDGAGMDCPVDGFGWLTGRGMIPLGVALRPPISLGAAPGASLSSEGSHHLANFLALFRPQPVAKVVLFGTLLLSVLQQVRLKSARSPCSFLSPLPYPDSGGHRAFPVLL